MLRKILFSLIFLLVYIPLNSQLKSTQIELSNYLELPSINLRSTVFESYSYTSLDNNLIINFLPDINGNTVIYGHRYTNTNPFNSVFKDLDKVEVGDELLLSWNRRKYIYEVSDIVIVNPDELWIYSRKEYPTITLITCTPMYNPINRLVIFARLVSIHKL